MHFIIESICRMGNFFAKQETMSGTNSSKINASRTNSSRINASRTNSSGTNTANPQVKEATMKLAAIVSTTQKPTGDAKMAKFSAIEEAKKLKEGKKQFGDAEMAAKTAEAAADTALRVANAESATEAESEKMSRNMKSKAVSPNLNSNAQGISYSISLLYSKIATAINNTRRAGEEAKEAATKLRIAIKEAESGTPVGGRRKQRTRKQRTRK